MDCQPRWDCVQMLESVSNEVRQWWLTMVTVHHDSEKKPQANATQNFPTACIPGGCSSKVCSWTAPRSFLLALFYNAHKVKMYLSRWWRLSKFYSYISLCYQWKGLDFNFLWKYINKHKLDTVLVGSLFSFNSKMASRKCWKHYLEY